MTLSVAALLGLLATLFIGCDVPESVTNAPHPVPVITPLEASALPTIVHQGDGTGPGPRDPGVPDVVTPSQMIDDQSEVIGKAGTGFFISSDGTLLTAAHVVSGCNRTQIISQYVPSTWASVALSDETNDIAILKAVDLRAPATLRVASVAPVSDDLLILGYPASAGLTVAATTWAVTENDKFLTGTSDLADPHELLWMSAPEVTHGYSGGPVFDPKLGAVVGIVKGEVEAGYLRLVPGLPTSGIAIGPGINPMNQVLRHEVPYVPVSLVSSASRSNEATLRRATVHVLCWR